MLGDTWGTTSDEIGDRYACDGYVVDPTLSAWRAVTIEAPVAVVWRWLVQVRLAPYSYDWVDNLGRRSPRELRGVADPVPGDPFTAVAGRPAGTTVAVEHEVHLTAQIMGVFMTYRLQSLGPDRTRLVLKIVGRPVRGTGTALCLGDLVMARRQLLTFKRLAEAGR